MAHVSGNKPMPETKLEGVLRRHMALSCHGPLVRYVKLNVAHAPEMPGTFPLLPRISDPDMHHDRCVTHVPWYMLGSLTSGFLWSRWLGKRSRHSRRMLNPQFCVSGKRPMTVYKLDWWIMRKHHQNIMMLSPRPTLLRVAPAKIIHTEPQYE